MLAISCHPWLHVRFDCSLHVTPDVAGRNSICQIPLKSNDPEWRSPVLLLNLILLLVDVLQVPDFGNDTSLLNVNIPLPPTQVNELSKIVQLGCRMDAS